MFNMMKKIILSVCFFTVTLNTNYAQTIEMIKAGGIREADMEVGGKALFTMAHEDEFSFQRLWITDGTVDGTEALSDVVVINGTYYKFNGRIYFNGQSSTGDHSCELWATDGTTAGTVRVKEITSTPGWNQWQITYMGVYNDRLYFRASDGVAGYELWVTDGTEDGTYLLKDLTPGSAGSDIAYHRNNIVFNNKFYFVANANGLGAELWVTDGTAQGTTIVKDINPTGGIHDGTYSLPTSLDVNLHRLYEFNNRLFFLANDGTNGAELWISDGTEAGTNMLKNINSTGSASPARITIFNNKLYFSANTVEEGRELWVTDGTESGTILLRDINVGDSGSSVNNLKSFNNYLYFTASRPVPGGLWRTDGTQEGTVLFEDSVRSFHIYNNELYMARVTGFTSPNYHYAISKSNGSINSTTLIRALDEGQSQSVPSLFLEAEGKLFFFREYDPFNEGVSFHAEIWYTDGTSSNTNILRYDNGEIVCSRHFWNGDQFVYNDNLYFEVEFAEPNPVTNGLYKVSGIPTSIAEKSRLKAVVYPNPAQSILNIQTETSIVAVNIYNAMGAIVQTEKSNSFSINHLQTGLYLVSVNTQNGTSIHRVLKQ
jgi:ELWxxDGT repeat protein